MRAVVVDPAGLPRLDDLPEPEGDGEIVRVLACGLCGSDVEKLGPAAYGAVLGHEVVAERDDGTRVVLVHHLPCGECDRCSEGHESTCERFREPTIVPGGFAEQARATGGAVAVPDGVPDAIATYAEPLACVLRGAERVPRGDVLVVGGGFVGTLFARVLERRGSRVFVLDRDPARSGPEPPDTVDAVVHTAPAGAGAGLERLRPGGLLLVFADAGPLDLGAVYRRELTVVGSRSATPRHLEEAAGLLARLNLPAPVVLPLDRFAEGLDLYRTRAALKVVFTPADSSGARVGRY
jgi:L-iditol 2-dehydrogenase